MKTNEIEDKQQFEILKAVAQAWLGHSGSSRSTNESDAYRRNFPSKPSRFKLQATTTTTNSFTSNKLSTTYWDFNRSLLDSYEIVTMSKRIERGLLLDDPFSGLTTQTTRVHKRPRDSKNSLRSLFARFSSRRFN